MNRILTRFLPFNKPISKNLPILTRKDAEYFITSAMNRKVIYGEMGQARLQIHPTTRPDQLYKLVSEIHESNAAIKLEVPTIETIDNEEGLFVSGTLLPAFNNLSIDTLKLGARLFTYRDKIITIVTFDIIPA